MVGLDRAAVWIQLEVDAELAILGIRKKFPHIKAKKLTGNTQTFKINKDNINEIRVKEKAGKTLIKIDFSYSKYKREDNLYPLEDEKMKVLVEDELVNIVEEIALVKINRNHFKYEYLEVCSQENIKSFSQFHNIISAFYRGLKRNVNYQDGIRFENYNSNLDFYYNTGFIYQVNRGWKIRLYNKILEHNKKATEKIIGNSIRLEHRLTTTVLTYFCKSAKISEITISTLKEKILSEIGLKLFKYLESEVQRDIDLLEEKFKDYTSRSLVSLIRDLQEHILDVEVVNYVVTSLGKTSERQIKRYRQRVKEILKEFQENNGIKRCNFGNIERLEFFIKKILCCNIKVKINNKERLHFISY